MTTTKGATEHRLGFACVALDNPKCSANVGGAMRAAACYGADMVVVSGMRADALRHPTNTMKAWRFIPTIRGADVFDHLPHDCVPVAVELIDEAYPLPRYVHPERAFYVFGAEDATLGKRVLSRCRDVVYVPTAYSMNLSATVNVVLYDRMAKKVGVPITRGESST